MTEKANSIENIKGYVWHNYKMKYAKDKRGFWLIVDYRKQNYFGFVDEGILGKAINDNRTKETIEKVVDNITQKIMQNLYVAVDY
jgi:hypothetical protein